MNQTMTRKCSERAVWMLSTELMRLKPVDSEDQGHAVQRKRVRQDENGSDPEN